jgi:1,4-dihydroxy-2-naphthoyl-CoA hydrolase
MKIWKKTPILKEINDFSRGTIHDALGIQFTAIGDDYLEATMPVDQRTKQPTGLLHGGASVVLAESLGSIASILVAGMDGVSCVGLEVSASHLNSVKSGNVVGRVTPIRLGKSIHVWEIRVQDISTSSPRLICHSKLTVLVR